MPKTAIEQAVQFAVAHETEWSRDVGGHWGIYKADPPPYDRLLGPVHGRGPVSGTITIGGRTLASWGEPERADLTFSVAKMYLALLAGVAYDRGLLPDVDEAVGRRVHGIGFDAGHNAAVTWRHLFQQTSEWEGECFGVPDRVDRYRTVQFQLVKSNGKKGEARPLQAPGTYWEYNDVRINQMSLALLHLFRRPLPEVFREAVMQPIGASDGWHWVGYDNSWLEIDGQRMQSVPGGTHWGGGMSIGSIDQAKVGELMLNQGRAAGRQVISAEWLQKMREPCAIAPFYGFLIWLNNGRRVFPAAPESSFFGFGAGSSFTWVEPERNMVVVVRWINADHANEFFARVLQAVDGA
jgi:CubicO group peptidase (beta-lactamase class C family)